MAVAAARHGRRTAVITRTGDDPFGDFVHQALRELGVDDRFVSPVAGLPTPVTFCEIFPPDDFPLYFYRLPKAPDLEIEPAELDLDAIRDGPRLLVDRHRPVAGAEPVGAPRRLGGAGPRAAHRARPGLPADVLAVARRRARGRRQGAGARDRRGRQPRRVRDRGRRERPRARRPRRCCDRGVELAVVKQGPRGVLGRDARRDASRCRRHRSRWSTGSVPVTASAARCVTACWPAGRSSGACGSRTRPVRSSRRGSSAARRCRRPPRSRTRSRRGRCRARWLTSTSTRLRELRAHRPEAVAEACARRAPPAGARRVRPADAGRRRPPGARLLSVRDRPMAMADRYDLLVRAGRARWAGRASTGCSARPTSSRTCCCSGALEDKVVIGSMNRGGLQGRVVRARRPVHGVRRRGDRAGAVRRRQDARPASTSTTPAPSPPSRRRPTRSTTSLPAGSIAMVEPFISRRVDGRVRNDLSTEAVHPVGDDLVRASVAPAPTPGSSCRSSRTWTGDGRDDAADAAARRRPDESPEETYATWAKALALPGVRGLIVGRALLYPADDDVACGRRHGDRARADATGR